LLADDISAVADISQLKKTTTRGERPSLWRVVAEIDLMKLAQLTPAEPADDDQLTVMW